MRVLALDTSTRAGSVAVVDDERVIMETAGDATRSHAERLPADVLRALAAAGLTVADVDLFAVASGPGSFTGLRIGIATVQGLAFVHHRRIVPVSALRALAEIAVPRVRPGECVGAWMDAHRHDVFSALYRLESSGAPAATLTEIEGPMVSPPAATIERWNAFGLPGIVCGDGAITYRATLPPDVQIVEPRPLAAAIARLALAAAAVGETVTPAGVQPLYVRRPDAEIARDAAMRRA
jgi:tRNA threonylcarbamoyladenosine biosynthesis protein TsaB